MNAGAATLKKKNYKAAIPIFSTLLDEDGANWKCRALLAVAYLGNKDAKAAELELLRLRYNPNVPPALVSVLELEYARTTANGRSVSVAPDSLVDAILAAQAVEVRSNPLTVYTLCIAAAYAELIDRFPDPVQSVVLARSACGPSRGRLEEDIRTRAGDDTEKVLLEIDLEILKKLRPGPAPGSTPQPR